MKQKVSYVTMTMMPLSSETREQNRAALAHQDFDVLVIGGGVTGADTLVKAYQEKVQRQLAAEHGDAKVKVGGVSGN